MAVDKFYYIIVSYFMFVGDVYCFQLGSDVLFGLYFFVGKFGVLVEVLVDSYYIGMKIFSQLLYFFFKGCCGFEGGYIDLICD